MLCVIMCFVRVRYAVVGCLSAFVVVCVFLLLHFRDFVLLFCCFVCACLGFCRLCPNVVLYFSSTVFVSKCRVGLKLVKTPFCFDVVRHLCNLQRRHTQRAFCFVRFVLF